MRKGHLHLAKRVEGGEPFGLFLEGEPEACRGVPQADFLVGEGQPLLEQSNPRALPTPSSQCDN